MGPIHWGAYAGEDLETVMAILVAQDHPATIRRVPASGDGGIDLLVPDGDGYIVKQVKRFTARLGPSERRQIAHSVATAREDPRVDRPITAYQLVVPTDLTPQEQAWFEQLASRAPWPMAWLGATHWHSLASQHPHVIDYFFGGGRDRVVERSLALQHCVVDPSSALQAVDVAGNVERLRAVLNKEDPHYRYELRTAASSDAATSSPDDAVLSWTRPLDAGGYLCVTVHPKHRYSLDDRPIAGMLSVSLDGREDAPDLREALIAFETFGRPVELPPGTVTFSIDAPGGLGGAFEGGGAWIGPVNQDAPLPPLDLVVVGPDQGEIDRIELEITQRTIGIAGGAELHLTDRASILRIVLQLEPPSASQRVMNITIGTNDPTGRPVVEVLPALEAAGAMAVPNRAELRVRFSSRKLGWAEPDNREALVARPWLEHLRDLGYLQQLAVDPITVPDAVESAFARQLHERVQMLQGEVLEGTWDDVVVNLSVPRSEIAELSQPSALAVTSAESVEIDDQTIELGPFTTILHHAQLADDQADDMRARLVPATTNRFTRRAGGPTA